MADIQPIIDQYLQDATISKDSAVFKNTQRLLDAGKRLQENYLKIIEQVGTNAENTEEVQAEIDALTTEIADINADIAALYALVAAGGGGGGGATKHVDYDSSITGVRNGVNQTFTAQYEFIPTTVEVRISGLQLTPGVGNDYVEVGTQNIQFFKAPRPGENLIFSYSLPVVEPAP